MSVCIQQEDFDQQQQYQQLCQDAPNIGAIVTFSGLVRDFDQGKGEYLFIEHFPTMAETVLKGIIQQAQQHWPIINARIVHRVGRLAIGEQIVFVGVNSPHRRAAFQACEYMIDHLKTEAPLWKKALSKDKHYWIPAKERDQQAKQSWHSLAPPNE